jgi:shikimate kinase
VKHAPIIILIGFMGSGKTSTGKELAKEINFEFLDTDQWIEEKNKKTIAQMFKDEGEKLFRAEEKEAIRFLGGRSRLVVSTGGGLWVDENNRAQLLSLGWCIWLQVSPEEALKRVKAHPGQRPLLAQSTDPLGDIRRLLEKRTPVYQLAHTVISTDGKDAKRVAGEILDEMKNNSLIDLV